MYFHLDPKNRQDNPALELTNLVTILTNIIPVEFCLQGYLVGGNYKRIL